MYIYDKFQGTELFSLFISGCLFKKLSTRAAFFEYESSLANSSLETRRVCGSKF